MNLTCIVCPRGCSIDYEIVSGEAVDITGNSCPRGKAYTENEVKCPTRMITSTVPIAGALYARLPVITSKPIPKDRIFAVMAEIRQAAAAAPVSVNDVVIKDVAGTGADILASRSLARLK